MGVREINEDHWRKYGRHFYTRCDYEGVESEAADRMFDHIRGKIADNSLARGRLLLPCMCYLSTLYIGVKLAEGWTVASAEEYRYVDPIDGSIAEKQGLIITFENGGRIVFRLSGTGSAGRLAAVQCPHENLHSPQVRPSVSTWSCSRRTSTR